MPYGVDGSCSTLGLKVMNPIDSRIQKGEETKITWHI